MSTLAESAHWLNFGLSRGKGLLDPQGIVAEGLQRLQTLPESHRAYAPALLDTYLNSTYRSLKACRQENELGARLHASMGIQALIDALFRLAGKWTPYWDRLDGHWEQLQPLGLDVEALRREIVAVVTDSSVTSQQNLYRRISGWMREGGHAELLDAWNSGFHALLSEGVTCVTVQSTSQ